MNKLFTQILFLALASIFGVKATCKAQTVRSVNISPTLLSPQSGTNVPTGSSTQLAVSYKNQGPDTLQATDTIRLALFIDNDLVMAISTPGDPPDSFVAKETGYTLLPGDSFIVTYPPLQFGHIDDGDHSICVLTYTRGTDLRDPINSNNRACASISTGPLSIEKFPENNLAFYPQPANDVLSWRLPAGQSIQMIAVYDLMGQQVIKEQDVSTQNSLSVSHLPTGFYTVRVRFGNGETYQQKLQVLR